MNGSSQNGDSRMIRTRVPRGGSVERRNQLNRKLEGQRKGGRGRAEVPEAAQSGYAQAMKLSSEFIAGVVWWGPVSVGLPTSGWGHRRLG
jgi:ATP synthase protein I